MSKPAMSLTLFTLRDFLRAHPEGVFMWQLTATFHCSPETIRPLLERWMRKGCVQQNLQTPCQGCAQNCQGCQLQCWTWCQPPNTTSSP